jgi:hypothetical protein
MYNNFNHHRHIHINLLWYYNIIKFSIHLKSHLLVYRNYIIELFHYFSNLFARIYLPKSIWGKYYNCKILLWLFDISIRIYSFNYGIYIKLILLSLGRRPFKLAFSVFLKLHFDNNLKSFKLNFWFLGFVQSL